MTAFEMLVALSKTDRKMVDLEFKEEYLGSTGYLEPLAAAELDLEIGTRFRLTTPAGSNRRVVGVVTPVGQVVFFERFTPGHGPEVVVMNYPQGLAGLYPGGAVSEETISQAMGGEQGFGANIGQVLRAYTTQLARLIQKDLAAVELAIVGEVQPEDTLSDSSLPPEAYARMAMTRNHAKAVLNQSHSIDMSDLMDKIQTELQNKPRVVPPSMIEELAAMLPESEYNHRRATIALSIGTEAPESLEVIMVKLRSMSKEDVGRVVQYTLVNWLPLKAMLEAQTKLDDRS